MSYGFHRFRPKIHGFGEGKFTWRLKKIPASVVTNTSGNCPKGHSTISSGLSLANVETQP